MKIEVYKNSDLPIIVIDDFFDKSACESIWREFVYLNDGTNKMRSPEQTGAGYRIVNGEKIYLKNNIGTVLDAVYQDKSISNILMATRQIYRQDIVENLISAHKFFKFITNVNNDSVKVHYFESGHYYKPHHDASLITVIYYFYTEPRMFDGGDLRFEDGPLIECKNNRCLIFPSILTHEVETLTIPGQYQNKLLGRYAISQFMYIEDKNVRNI